MKADGPTLLGTDGSIFLGTDGPIFLGTDSPKTLLARKKGHYTKRGKWRKREPPYSSKMTNQLRNISTHSENI